MFLVRFCGMTLHWPHSQLLERYFELSKPDATRALNIYRTFVKQTEAVVQYLSIARLHEHSTRLEIPKIKHAPTSLAASLEEYLNDKDFDINRRQYLAEKEVKKDGGKSTNGTSKSAVESKPVASRPATTSQPTTAPSQPAAPSAPLIDFFGSIQDNQQTMAQPQLQQQYPQQTGFQQPTFQVPQQTAAMGFPQQQQPFQQQQQQQQQQLFSPQSQGTNPFAQMQQAQQLQQTQQSQQPQQPQQPQLQTQFTGAGFGGYTPQPFSPQNSSLASIPQNGVPSFTAQPMPTTQQYPSIAEPMQAQQTATNPFRQSTMPPAPTGPAEPKLLNNPPFAASTSELNRSPTNPFAKHNTGFQQQVQSPAGLSSSPFSSMPSIQENQTASPFAPQQPQALQPAPTGTNPFARNHSPINSVPSPQGGLSPPGGLSVHATGSTNPFRQSAFVNQQTGQAWQNTGTQGTLGGMSMDQVPTMNVFPRPGQQQNGQFLG